ncbi:hypothetical protein I315_04161 [Cryptococcus gattii Ru294]|nr:hypothetical protein I315_04161 [Cryptococcus gattii Ru294]
MVESMFQPSLMGNSWCLDDPYGIIRQFCAENASIGDDTADLRTDNGISVVAASAGSLSCLDNSVGIFFDQDFAFPSMGWATEMYDSIVPMEAAGDNIHSTSISRPVDLRAPRLQGAELFIGAHMEGTVSSEVVEEREGAVDEGYEQRHQEALHWEQRRRRVEERQRAPVVSPCDQCHGVGAECWALLLFSTCGQCTVKGVRCSHNASGGRGSDVARDWEVLSPISSVSETNLSTMFEGVQQAIIAYLMEEEVLEVRRQEMRGRFQEDLLVALGMLHKRKRDDRDDSSEE